MNFVVGCPLSSREWIIERWFKFVEDACEYAGVTPHYLFAGRSDDASVEKAWDIAEDLDRELSVMLTNELEDPRDDRRKWSAERLDLMVDLRNLLLTGVRETGPDLFLSLDSDILLHPHAIRSMIEKRAEHNWDAIGSRAFLSRGGYSAPTFAFFNKRTLNGQPFKRVDSPECVVDAEILFAIKMMTPAAYNVDYRTDQAGEDAGWAKACRDHGVSLGWDGTVTSKHIMDRDFIDTFDSRCGY